MFSIIGTKDGASDEASINIKLIHVRDNKAFQDRLRPFLAGIPGAAITFQDVQTLGGSAASSLQQLPIQVNLRGTNLKDLTGAAEMVKDAIRNIPGLVDINSDYRNPKPEIRSRSTATGPPGSAPIPCRSPRPCAPLSTATSPRASARRSA